LLILHVKNNEVINNIWNKNKKHISSYSTGKEAHGIFFATIPIGFSFSNFSVE